MAERPRVSVVVPTYCEAANLAELTQRIAAVLHRCGRTFEIVVVDDNSPDETRRVCQALGECHPLRLIVREHERGLSSAVVTGLRAAAGDVLVVMDADLSHPPESIPDLVDLAEQPDVDFVIGSRYVPGAATAEDWGWFRQWNSRIATALARGLTRARDPMAGFMALRREIFERADPHLDPIGFKIGLELIVKAHCQRVVETPIYFANRKRGSSKLSWKEQVRYLQHLVRLYRYRLWARGDRAPPTKGRTNAVTRRRAA